MCSIDNDKGRIEVLALECTVNKEKWIFVSIYKQPKVNVTSLCQCIDSIMLHITEVNPNIVIYGDLNIDMLKANTTFRDTLDINGLTNIVKGATCIKGNPSLIDLIITNKPKRFTNTCSVDTEMSDFHNLVCTSTKFHVPQLKSTTFKYRSYKHFNPKSYTDALSHIPYQVVDIFDTCVMPV